MLLAAGSYLSQMMLLAGMILLAWMLIRRNINMRRRGRSLNREFRFQEAAAGKAPRGAPLADAPKDVLRWQASMFDLQRELKAELDTKIVVVQSLIRLVDERMAQLKSLQLCSPKPAGDLHLGAGQFDQAAGPAASGSSAAEIAPKADIPQAEIESSPEAANDFPQPSDSA